MMGGIVAMLLVVLGEYLVSGDRLDGWSFNTPHVNNDSSEAYNWCDVTPTRIQIDYDRTFVVLPRNKPGVPFSIGVVPLQANNDYPSIAAFPNWGFNELGNCSAIQNAVDIELTWNNRLWVLDAGLTDNPDTPRSCPPKLLKFIFFVETNEYDGEVLNLPRIKNWQPSRVFLEKMQFQHNFAYILDANNADLSIVDVANNELELTVHLSNGGVPASIQNMALISEDENTHYLYFTYSGSDQLRRIGTHELRDSNYLNRIVTVRSVNHKISLIGSDNYHSIIYRISGESEVYKWNIKEKEPQKFVLKQVDVTSAKLATVALDYDEKIWAFRRKIFESGTGQCSDPRFQLTAQEMTSSSDPKIWCNMTITGMQVYRYLAILALPRNKPGVPFSLGAMPLQDGENPNFIISVFPSWDAQEPGNCNTIQNASDVKYTADGWLWVLDAGTTNSPWDDTLRPCPPNIFKIRTENDTAFEIQALNPTSINNWQPSKLFIETSQEGNHIAYILDANNAILSIFNVVSKRIELTIRLSNGVNPTRIQNMALMKKFDVHYLYFTYSGSDKLLKIGTHNLRYPNFLDKIFTVGAVDPKISFLGTDNNFIFFNYNVTPIVHRWGIVTTTELISSSNVSTIPSAVAVDSDRQMWVVRGKSVRSSHDGCLLQEVRRY